MNAGALLTRRAVVRSLAMTAGAVLATQVMSGCVGAGRGGGTHRLVHADEMPIHITPGAALWHFPSVLKRYQKANRGVAFDTSEKQGPIIWDVAANSGNMEGALRTLNTAMNAENFDPSNLLAGFEEGFSIAGSRYALPLGVLPLGVRWRVDVFQAAHVPAPAPDWTLDNFIDTCARLKPAIDRGTVAGVTAVLPPMAGTAVTVVNGSPLQTVYGELETPLLWVAFVLGFGGSVVSQNAFDLTGEATLRGLDELLAIAREYGAPTSALTHATATGTDPWWNHREEYALDFVSYAPLGVQSGTPGTLRWARLPRMPVVPVIPMAIEGYGVVDATNGRLVDGSSDAIGYVVKFLLWLYGQAQQEDLAAGGITPVIRDASLQDRFWAVAPDGASAVGDWRNFTNYSEGWPALVLPNGRPVFQVIFDALSAAFSYRAGLSQAFEAASQTVNTQFAAAAQAAGGRQQVQASVAKAFPVAGASTAAVQAAR